MEGRGNLHHCSTGVIHLGGMVDLALKSVLHDWRRYLPVAIAVGVSGLMLVAQVALALGAFRLAAGPVEYSRAALWIGPADARAVDQSGGLSAFAASPLWLDPDIARIEPLPEPLTAQLGSDEAGQMALVSGLDISAQGLAYAAILTHTQRRALAEPGTVLIGKADADRLGVTTGDTLRVNRQPLRVAGVVPGLRALFGTPLLASEATRRALSTDAGGMPGFYLAALHPGADPEAVAARLMDATPAPEFRVWTAADLSASTVRVWALESGAGTMFLASAAIALVITLMVVNQTLGAAVAGNIREYAAMRAYGIPFRSIQGIVARQGAYVTLAALALTGVAAAALLGALRLRNVAVDLPPVVAAGLILLLAGVVTLSNLMAVRRLRRADPAALLR